MPLGSSFSSPVLPQQNKMGVITIGEIIVGRRTDPTLVTYALGSCAGVALYDPVAAVAGLAHCQLPDSTQYRNGTNAHPHRFCDRAIPDLLSHMERSGASRSRCIAYLAGCLESADPLDYFKVGPRNQAAATQVIRSLGIPLRRQHCGGRQPIAIFITPLNGDAWIRKGGQITALS